MEPFPLYNPRKLPSWHCQKSASTPIPTQDHWECSPPLPNAFARSFPNSHPDRRVKHALLIFSSIQDSKKRVWIPNLLFTAIYLFSSCPRQSKTSIASHAHHIKWAYETDFFKYTLGVHKSYTRGNPALPRTLLRTPELITRSNITNLTIIHCRSTLSSLAHRVQGFEIRHGVCQPTLRVQGNLSIFHSQQDLATLLLRKIIPSLSLISLKYVSYDSINLKITKIVMKIT